MAKKPMKKETSKPMAKGKMMMTEKEMSKMMKKGMK
jgi:hypothetical protein